MEYKGWDCDRECMGEDGRYSGELLADDVEVRLEGNSSNPRTWIKVSHRRAFDHISHEAANALL